MKVIYTRKIVRRIIIFLFSLAFIFSAACTKCDPDTPDTKINREALELFFKVKAVKEIKDVYFFADELGIDASYYFAFSAPPEVIEKIVQKMNMIELPADTGFDFACKWWNQEEQMKSRYYESSDKKKEILCQLWYSPKTEKCQACITYW